MAWNGSSSIRNDFVASKPKTKSLRKISRHLILPALIVVFGCCIAVVLMYIRIGTPESETGGFDIRKAPIADVKPQIEPTPAVSSNVTHAATNCQIRLEHGVEVVRESVATNNNGAVIERLWLADGRTVRKIRPAKPIFENPADQLIALSVSVRPGQSMPPLPEMSNIDEDFAKAMLSPIRIEASDSEEVKDLKIKVMEARTYLVEEIKNGGTVREALRQYQADMEMYADSHAMAAAQIKEIREREGDDAAQAFRDRINEVFKAKGIPELEIKEQSEATEYQ